MSTPLNTVAPAVLLERVRAILLNPQQTWPQIDAEDGSPARIYLGYLVFLAAIPAVAHFIGYSLVGVGAFGVTIRVPLLAGLAGMVVGYALSLAMVYVLALIANALAPRFQGRADMGSAFKLVAYGLTAAMVGGVFSILPMLAVLGLVAALYSIYLLYLGVPVLMRVPQQRAAGYTAVLVVCGIVAGVLVGVLSALVTPGMHGTAGLAGAGGAAPANIQIPGTDIKIDTRKIEEATRRMEEANRKMEQAQASGDTQAAAKAATEALGAALGGKAAGQALDVQQLRAVLPDSLAGMARTSVEARTDAMMGVQFSHASAQYEHEGKHVEVRVQDLGASSMLAAGMAAWAHSTSERETTDEVERVYRKGDVAFQESYRKDGSSADLSMLLPNGVMLTLGGALAIDELKRLAQPMAQQLGGLQRKS